MEVLHKVYMGCCQGAAKAYLLSWEGTTRSTLRCGILLLVASQLMYVVALLLLLLLPGCCSGCC
jgi:hypothetical protein